MTTEDIILSRGYYPTKTKIEKTQVKYMGDAVPPGLGLIFNIGILPRLCQAAWRA